MSKIEIVKTVISIYWVREKFIKFKLMKMTNDKDYFKKKYYKYCFSNVAQSLPLNADKTHQRKFDIL